MNVLIKPTIKINEAVKNKCFEYSLTLDKKTPTHLLIKARSSDGRGRGIVGKVLKDGTVLLEREDYKVDTLLRLAQNKINFTLDLMFGPKRDRQCTFNEKGLVEFNKQ